MEKDPVYKSEEPNAEPLTHNESLLKLHTNSSEEVQRLRQVVEGFFEYFSSQSENTRKTLHQVLEYQKSLESVLTELQLNKLQTALVEKQQTLNNILDSLPTGLLITNQQGQVTECNTTAVKMAKRAKQDILNQPINQIFKQPLLPEPLENNLSKISQNHRHEWVSTNADGGRAVLKSSTSLLETQPLVEAITATNKKPLGTLVQLEDITAITYIQGQIQRRKRLSATEEMAGKVAHEIGNLLASVELSASTLSTDLAQNPEYADSINCINMAVRSMHRVLDNLLRYANPRPLVKTNVDIQQLIQDYVSLMQQQCKSLGIHLKTEFNAQHSEIQADPEMLRQALQNLCLNALQASSAGQTLLIKLSNEVENSADRLALFKNSKAKCPATLLNIEVKDQGLGISLETQEKIFDPFFTTKEKGTGLGMSIVNNIIELHQGLISIDSGEDQGTNVKLQFLLDS